jgi:3-deoxy-D-manno-octulosonate 8-phosphate phosphatase (KDO 8-P phosphatase)
MRAAGLAFAVADAHPAAIQAADRVTPQAGGRGAVRSVCDLLITARERVGLDEVKRVGRTRSAADVDGRRSGA